MGPPPRRVPSIQMLPASLSAEMEAAAPLLQAQAASSAATAANAASGAAPSSSKQQYPRSLPITRRFEQVRGRVGHRLRECRLCVEGVNLMQPWATGFLSEIGTKLRESAIGQAWGLLLLGSIVLK